MNLSTTSWFLAGALSVSLAWLAGRFLARRRDSGTPGTTPARLQRLQRLERHAQALATLHQTSRDLTALQDLDSLLRQIVAHALSLLDRPTGGISLYQPESDMLEWVADAGEPLIEKGRLINVGEGVVGQVWQQGQPLIVNDYASWPGRAAQRGDLSAAVIGVPIQWQAQHLGVLTVADRSLRPFTDEDAELLQQFAMQAAIAIGNARLYAQTQQALEEQRRVEAELRQSEARYRTIFHSVSDALFIHDASSGEILDVNQRASEMYGYSRQEFVQLQVVDISSGERPFTQVEALVQMNAAIAQGQHQFEWRARHRDGRLFWVEVTMKPAQLDDRACVLVLVRDVGARKEAEQALKAYSEQLEQRVAERTLALQQHAAQLERQAAALTQAKAAAEAAREEAETQRENAERANRAKSTFLATMSHDLRTPLNGILGYAQILLRDASLGEQQRHGLAIIQDSGNHLLRLIDDVLDLSKIEAGRMELSPHVTHLPSLLNDIVSMIQLQAQAHAVTFHSQIDDALPEHVVVDDRRLRQIVINLLDNAVKFANGGDVTFLVERGDTASPAGAAERCTLRFGVRDTGVGIAPEQLARIFEPYEQVGQPRVKVHGTGLGLAISRRLVDLMDGRLTVDSSPGEGSQFWLTLQLPIAEAAGPPPVSADQVIGYEGAPVTILVIDDQRINRMVLNRILTGLGFTVLDADSGQAGVALARAHAPDVILLDLVMPEMDGYETAAALRELPELAQTSIVAVSASAFQEDINRSLAAGCNAFLSKPVNADQLLRLLADLRQLTWRLAEPAVETAVPPPPEAALVPPPPDELDRLLDLALRGDMRGIRTRAGDLADQDETYRPFAERLHKLAAAYDEQAVLALLEQQRGKR